MSNEFPIDSKVRFTKERLSVLTPRDRQGLEGRIGVVQTDSSRVHKPTVYFPTDGARLELRLFEVDPRHIELVESPANNESPESPERPDEGGRLSQSDMDNLFD